MELKEYRAIYRKEHLEEIKKNQKKYYKEHIEEFKEYMAKSYREKLGKLQLCTICNKNITVCNFKKHELTKIHIKFLNEINK